MNCKISLSSNKISSMIPLQFVCRAVDVLFLRIKVLPYKAGSYLEAREPHSTRYSTEPELATISLSQAKKTFTFTLTQSLVTIEYTARRSLRSVVLCVLDQTGRKVSSAYLRRERGRSSFRSTEL